MSITSEDISKLRERTGAGILDCKKALEQSQGDVDKAGEYLREKGIVAAAKKADRIAAEGVVASYIHLAGRIGVLAEVNCETDFVAQSDKFTDLVKNITMQIAAAKPEYVRITDIPADVLAHEKEIIRAQVLNEGKPAAIVDRIVEGKIKKFYEESCLMEQAYIKDPEKTVTTIINEAIMAIGEKISIRRFVRYEMGEGLAKRENNLVADIQEQMSKKK